MTVAQDQEEFLTLADGTKIGPDGKVMRDPNAPSPWTEVPAPSEAQALVVRARKSVNELPLPPEKMSAVGLVAFYTLFGLNDTDIAIALDGRITEQQIENIRNLSAYQDFMKSARATFMETEQEAVRDIFSQHAAGAARQVVELAKDSDNDVLKFKASQDILDRAGHRPADIVEHRHKMEDALHIVIERKDNTAEIPAIDVTPEHVDG